MSRRPAPSEASETELEEMMRPHGRWDIRSAGPGDWTVYPVYRRFIRGEGRTLLEAVRSACSQIREGS